MKKFALRLFVSALLGGAVLPVSALGTEAATNVDRLTVSREAMVAKYGQDSRFLNVDGVDLRYKEEGAGQAILLIHGSFGSLDDWDGWLPALVPGYRVIRFDLPGFGLTGPMPNGNYSIDRMESLVDNFMDALGIDHFTIVGTSYGGIVAFRYAATRRSRVDGLILMNSAGIEFGGRKGTAPAPKASPNDFITRPVMDEAYMRRALSAVINDASKLTPMLIERKVDMANIDGRADESRIATGLYERGTPERVLAHVHAPTLVMWGGANKALSIETADAFAKGAHNACIVQTIIYPGGGHALNIDQPKPTARDARAFLDANRKRRSERCR